MQTEAAEPINERKWGGATLAVIEAIQNNCTTLRDIANYTGIEYRQVNSTVTSLEKQQRVIADDYNVKRCDQRFTVVRATKSIGRPVCHPRTHAALQLQSLVGAGSLPESIRLKSARGRVYRISWG